MKNITEVLIVSLIGSGLGLAFIFVYVPLVLKAIIWVDRKYFGRTW